MRWKKNVLFFLFGALIALVANQIYQSGRDPYTVRAQGKLLPFEETVIRVSRDLLPTVVSITTRGVVARESFFGTVQQRAEGQGSGVIVREDGYVLTNRHVVTIEGAIQQTVTVVLPNGKAYQNARVLDTDPRSDLAVIKIPANNLPAAPLGNSDELQVGQMSIALGNPLGLTQTVTTGIISAKNRVIQSERGPLEGLLQTDAAINPGNSGGALADSSGRLIGINTAIASLQGGGNIGIGFAVPINVAKAILDDIAKYGRIRIPWLGIELSDVPPQWQQAYNLPAGVIVRPVPRGPADAAGLQQFDVIIRADNTAVKTAADLQTFLRTKSVGDTVNFRVFRDGKELSVRVQLRERPRDERV